MVPNKSEVSATGRLMGGGKQGCALIPAEIAKARQTSRKHVEAGIPDCSPSSPKPQSIAKNHFIAAPIDGWLPLQPWKEKPPATNLPC